MKVAELLIVLAHMPPDLDVFVQSRNALRHLDRVERITSRVLWDDERRYPGGVRLESTWRSKLWYEDPPPFRVDGPVRRRAAMEEALGWR